MKNNCENCYYFERFSEKSGEGKCNRYPPIPVFSSYESGHEDVDFYRPEVDGTYNFCGEFKIKK